MKEYNSSAYLGPYILIEHMCWIKSRKVMVMNETPRVHFHAHITDDHYLICSTLCWNSRQYAGIIGSSYIVALSPGVFPCSAVLQTKDGYSLCKLNINRIGLFSVWIWKPGEGPQIYSSTIWWYLDYRSSFFGGGDWGGDVIICKSSCRAAI